MITKLKNNKILVLSILIAILSVAIIFINQGFHFAYYKNAVVLQSENTEVFSQLTKLKGVSSVDNSTKRVFIQNQAKSFVDMKLAELNLTNVTTSEIVRNVKFESVIFRLMLVSLIILASGILSSFYFIFRKQKDIKLREVAKVFGAFSANYIIVTLVYLGLLSLLSRVYSLREVDIYSITLLNLLSILAITFILSEHLDEHLDFSSIKNKVLSLLKTAKLYLLITIVFLILLIFSLGVKFIVPSVLIILTVAGSLMVTRLAFELNTSKKATQKKEQPVLKTKKQKFVKKLKKKKKRR